MKIVICDDNREDLTEMERLILKYKGFCTHVGFEIEKYMDAGSLYHRIQEGDLADIYILDMVMSEKNGIDIGKQIRKADSKKVIIYITSSDEYALEAYGVHAARYLLKPVGEESFFEAMDHALAGMKTEKDAVFLVRTGDSLAPAPYSRIEAVENIFRRLVVHLADGEDIQSLIIRKSFEEEVGEILEDKRFWQVHKSFIVNLNYVKKLDRNDLLMESGRRIPVSRARAAEVKREYFAFISEKYR